MTIISTSTEDTETIEKRRKKINFTSSLDSLERN